MEEQVRKSKKAKKELEREMLAIKGKIEDLSKVEEQPELNKVTRVEEQPEKVEEHPGERSLRLKWLESLESRIETEEKELECPVCLEVASFLIF